MVERGSMQHYKCPKCGYWGNRLEFTSKRDMVERFLTHVEIPEDPEACWLWNGGLLNSGYGIFYPLLNQNTTAHRFMYLIFKGEIPPSPRLVVHHSCKNRICVNPEHLFLESYSQNMRHRTDYRGPKS